MKSESKKPIPRHALIVEDERALLEALAIVFTREGFSVTKAEDGVEGFSQVRKARPDIVILDLVMPRGDGVEFLKKLREDDEVNQIPVIVYSNISHGSRVEEAMKYSVSGFMNKTGSKLAEVVKKAKAVLENADHMENLIR